MTSRSNRTFGSPRAIVVIVAIVAIGVLAFALVNLRGSDTQDEVLTDLTNIANAAEAQTPAQSSDDLSLDEPASDGEEPDPNFPAIVDSAVKDPNTREVPVGLGFEVVETIPHDTGAFTQGFEISDGRLFESTGLVGRSSIRELDLATGTVLRQSAVADVFAEGLTIVDDTALQLTWQDGVAYRYDTETFERTDTYTYEGEGWGLCHDGSQLVMSNGSPTLQFRDPATFDLVSSVEVTFSGAPVEELNELECVNGMVWANIWQSSLIIEIDPSTGAVVSVLNGQALIPPSVENVSGAVLNGIAYDPETDTFLLTGKLWPSIFRVRIVDLPE